MAVKRIFIVEDDSIIKLLITTLISSMGHTVAGAASNADQAIEGIAATDPDLVIMDIGLQGDRDGVTLAQQIRKSVSVPFIYVTGNSDSNTITRARATKPLGFIFKPFDEIGFTTELQLFIDTM